MIPDDARLLRLYLDATRRWRGMPLYRAIVEEARARNLAGATVFPVDLALDAHGHYHDAASEYDVGEAPVVLEIIEAPERIAALLDALRPMIGKGLATVETARVVRYRHHEDRTGSTSDGGTDADHGSGAEADDLPR